MNVMLIVSHDAKKIKSLKVESSKCFDMKNLRSAKQIFHTRIDYDRKNDIVRLSQERRKEQPSARVMLFKLTSQRMRLKLIVTQNCLQEI